MGNSVELSEVVGINTQTGEALGIGKKLREVLYVGSEDDYGGQ